MADTSLHMGGSAQGNLLLGELCGVLDLLGHGVIVTSCTGTDTIHSIICGEVVASSSDKIDWGANHKILVQVLKVLQHVGVLQTKGIIEHGRSWSNLF